MRHKIISVSMAKSKLLELVRNANEAGEAYLLTKDGEPIGALVPLEDYEALLETADVLSDPNTLKDLEQALEDEKKSRLWKRDSKGQWIKNKKKRSKPAA
mgnify:CR=1 FL=1